MFCMTKECFDILCGRIIATVGEKNFKSEQYIESTLKSIGHAEDFDDKHATHDGNQ
jgi:hypothetical protein